MRRFFRKLLLFIVLVLAVVAAAGRYLPRRWIRALPRPSLGRSIERARDSAPRTAAPGAPQPRLAGQRVPVPGKLIHIDDGDTIRIRWPGEKSEEVRLLGIDSPEIAHPSHGRPFGQKEGPAAVAFLREKLENASQIELLRATMLDQFGRSLAYLWIDGRNYSADIVDAGLAYENISTMGTNGLPGESQQVLDAARRAGVPPFEAPYLFRRRMKRMDEQGEFRKSGTQPAADARTP